MIRSVAVRWHRSLYRSVYCGEHPCKWKSCGRKAGRSIVEIILFKVVILFPGDIRVRIMLRCIGEFIRTKEVRGTANENGKDTPHKSQIISIFLKIYLNCFPKYGGKQKGKGRKRAEIWALSSFRDRSLEIVEVESMEMKKRRYCIFAAHYLPHLGGIERYVYNMTEQLTKYGDEVCIVTSRTGDLLRYEIINGTPVYRVECYELLEGRYPILKFNKETRQIFRILKDKHFDMIIINARFYLHSTAAALFARRNHIPCIVLEHGSSHLTIHNPVWDFIGELFEHVHTGILKKICRNYYGTCEACNEWLEHFHIRSKGIIYNGINVSEVNRSLKVCGNFRKKYGISPQDTVVVFTGRLLAEKGLLSLLEAVERINQSEKKVYLFVAGDGDLKEEVDKKKSKYIIPLGYIEHEKVFQLLDESNIYCLPSVSEAFCGGVLEAVACKCYIITTSQGGSKELISSEELGTIIDNNDADTVYYALKRALDNWGDCEKAIEKSYRKLMDNYTWDIIGRQVRELKI